MSFPARRLRRKRLSTRQREELYDACTLPGERYPRCNIPGCGVFVTPGQRWVESHFPSPHALGGDATGVAHARCNHDYFCRVEAPLIAHVKGMRRRHIGAFVPRTPLPGGRDDRLKRKIGGRWPVERVTGLPWAPQGEAFPVFHRPGSGG